MRPPHTAKRGPSLRPFCVSRCPTPSHRSANARSSRVCTRAPGTSRPITSALASATMPLSSIPERGMQMVVDDRQPRRRRALPPRLDRPGGHRPQGARRQPERPRGHGRHAARRAAQPGPARHAARSTNSIDCSTGYLAVVDRVRHPPHRRQHGAVAGAARDRRDRCSAAFGRVACSCGPAHVPATTSSSPAHPARRRRVWPCSRPVSTAAISTADECACLARYERPDAATAAADASWAGPVPRRPAMDLSDGLADAACRDGDARRDGCRHRRGRMPCPRRRDQHRGTTRPRRLATWPSSAARTTSWRLPSRPGDGRDSWPRPAAARTWP